MTWSWTTGAGQIDARRLVGAVVEEPPDHEMHDADAGHPGGGRGRELRQPPRSRRRAIATGRKHTTPTGMLIAMP